jgi:signal transduction histidine kinase
VLRSLRSLAKRSPHRLWLVLWPAGALVGIAAESSLYGWADGGNWASDLVTGWILIGCGLIGWARRPESRSGALLTATGFVWFAPNFATVGVGSFAWLSGHVLYLYRGPLVQLVLTYPRGRRAGRLEALTVAVGYGVAVFTTVWRSELATIVLAAVMIGVAVRAYFLSAGRERRERLFGVEATVFLAIVLMATASIRLAIPTYTADTATLRAFEVALCALSVSLLIGLLRAPWDRAEVTDLVVELGEGRSATLRDALARVLGDPSLQIGFWVAEANGFVDAQGRAVTPPDSDSERSTTMVDWEGEPIAMLIHDPAVLDDPGLLDAITAAARLAGTNARLQAEVRAQLMELNASRRRIIAAGDEERSRLERRLREGAQVRLDQLAATLRTSLLSAGSPETIERIARSERRLARTKDELLRLGRGIHPRELSDHGLATALHSLASEFPLPVELSVSEIDASLSVEACIYFVCSEALANVAKYASASRVCISVSTRQGIITAQVEDDGVGGADPDRGTGLRGLSDRLDAIGGSLSVRSPHGRGARLIAVIPQDFRP